MKAKTILFICLFTVLLYGCVATPDHEIVINKGDAVFEKKVKEAKESEIMQDYVTIERNDLEKVVLTTPPVETDFPVCTPFVEEAKWVDRIPLKNFDVKIDVTIEAPETAQFPVYQVEQSDFSKDFVWKERIIPYLCGTINGIRPGGQTTEDLMKKLDSLDRGVYDPDTKERFPYTKEEYSAISSDILNRLKSAVSEDDYEDSNTIDTSEMPLLLSLRCAQNQPWELIVRPDYFLLTRYRTAILQMESWVIQGEAVPEEPKGTQLNHVNCTEEEAREFVNAFLSTTGLDIFAISEIEKARFVDAFNYDTIAEGWYVQCAKCVSSCPPFEYTHFTAYGGMLRFSDETYAAGLAPESLRLFVNETGIVQIAWQNPTVVLEKTVNSIELMSVNEIRQIIKQTVRNSVSWLGDAEEGSRFSGCSIIRVVLSYCYVPVKNHPNQYYFTPTWFVLIQYDGQAERGIRPYAIAINAVDGTRIDLNSIS